MTPLLPLWPIEARFRAKRSGPWPHYAGSAWRGALGHALRRLVCVTGLPVCAGCPLTGACPYPAFFEPALVLASARGGRPGGDLAASATPLALLPKPAARGRLDSGDIVALRVTLVGHARHHAAYVRRALEEAGAAGIGPGRTPLEMVAWEEEAAPGHGLEGAGPALLRLHTPLRLKRQGRLLTPETLAPADLLMALVRRVSLLAGAWTDEPVRTDFRRLKDEAGSVAWCQARLAWQETTRFSSRQGTLLKMGGVVGTAVVDLEALRPFQPFLSLMPFIGVGKGASMGLGHVTLEPLP